MGKTVIYDSRWRETFFMTVAEGETVFYDSRWRETFFMTVAEGKTVFTTVARTTVAGGRGYF